jgi:hypothetical protein
MNRFLTKLCLGIVLSIQTLSADWADHWIKAVQFCKDRIYVLAEQEFNLAIQDLESTQNIDHPHVYVDRAKLYSLLERDQEALVDANKGLESPFLQANDILRARIARYNAFLRLDIIDSASNELGAIKKIYAFPEMEIFENTVIIRNVPDCECSQEIIKSAMTAYFCNKEEDIEFLPSGICIAKRTKQFPGQDESLHCECNKDAKFNLNMNANNDGCNWSCDKCATGGMLMCPKWFKVFKCQAICVAVVEALKEGCYWCCSNDGFYKNCIKPFEDIVGKVGNGCDPAWD